MPHGDAHRHGGHFGRALRYAPLTLTTLAALVPRELNAEIRLIDEGVEDLDLEDIEADLVGITCLTGTSHRAYQISDSLRARGIATVLGGVHPTLLPQEAQHHATTIVTGYAEETWPELLLDFSRGRLRSKYAQSPDFRFCNMPEPRRDLLRPRSYITINTVQASRGCPWRCSFCVVPAAWPGYHHRPVREVITEIERLRGDRFLFLDLSPIEDADYIKRLYRELIPLKKKWGGLATMAITRDDEMLKLASRSGCRGLLLGIESVSEATIRSMGKRLLNDPSDYVAGIRKLHDHGIMINGCFVLGLDGDDRSTFERTVEFVAKAAIDLPRFSLPTPFPNTGLHHRLKRQGRLLHEDWKLYDTQHVVFQPKAMSPEVLQEGFQWTWKQAYSLSCTVRRIANSGASRSPAVLQSIGANMAYRLFSRHLPDFAFSTCELEPPSRALPVRRDAECA